AGRTPEIHRGVLPLALARLPFIKDLQVSPYAFDADVQGEDALEDARQDAKGQKTANRRGRHRSGRRRQRAPPDQPDREDQDTRRPSLADSGSERRVFSLFARCQRSSVLCAHDRAVVADNKGNRLATACALWHRSW